MWRKGLFHRANKLLTEKEECEGGRWGGGAIANRYREAKALVERGGKMNGQGGREEFCREWAYEERKSM